MYPREVISFPDPEHMSQMLDHRFHWRYTIQATIGERELAIICCSRRGDGCCVLSCFSEAKVPELMHSVPPSAHSAKLLKISSMRIVHPSTYIQHDGAEAPRYCRSRYEGRDIQ